RGATPLTFPPPTDPPPRTGCRSGVPMPPWPSSPTDPPLLLLLNSLHSKHRHPRPPIRVVLPWRPVASAPLMADGGIASTSPQPTSMGLPSRSPPATPSIWDYNRGACCV